MSSQDEIIPIVNLDDEIIGYKARKDITADDIYRTTGCWIKDEDNNILLAQRSWNKKIAPGKRGGAVAGTVNKGESYFENIIHEIKEELGITPNLKMIKPGIKYLRERHDRKHFSQRFLYIYDGDKSVLRAEEGAVEQLKRFSPEDLKELIDSFPDDFLESVKWGLENF